jgi:hypothetical protein
MRQLNRRSALRYAVAAAAGITVLTGVAACSDDGNEGDVDENVEDQDGDNQPDDDQGETDPEQEQEDASEDSEPDDSSS